MAQIQVYEEIGIGAQVFLPESGPESPLEIDEKGGILAIPKGCQPTGFHLTLMTTRETRVVIAQKNVGRKRGKYLRNFLDCFGPTNELVVWTMYEPIQVSRAGSNVWTVWHSKRPNRVDCWLLKEDGRLQLWQVGVITHDDGKTFRLLTEPRWKGKVFKASSIVAPPDDPKWGKIAWDPGESRNAIREHPEFQALLASANLQSWNGSPEELDPPLGEIPFSHARVDWYIPFAGQKGQGIAKLTDGSSAWISGENLDIQPDPDGIKRLWHNDLVSFFGLHHGWGTKKGPPKLIRAKKI